MSNIARRQKKQAQENDHYGKADGVWELLNPEELKVIQKEEKAGLKDAKRNIARKLVQRPGADVSSEEIDGRRVIIDFADIDRAKRELAAAETLQEDREEDSPVDLLTVSTAAATGAGRSTISTMN